MNAMERIETEKMQPLRREKSWDFDEAVNQCNPNYVRPVSLKHRKDRKQNTKWIEGFTPKSAASASKQPNQSKEFIDWKVEKYGIRVPITIKDSVTGELKQVMMRMKMREITLMGYGKVWTFKKSDRGSTYVDSRDGKRKSPAFIRTELIRLLGADETRKLSAELTA
jgi:Lhr-like helicase